MNRPGPRSGHGRARHAGTLLRLYLSPLGPLVAVLLFVSGAGLWWALGWLAVWMGVARLLEKVGGR